MIQTLQIWINSWTLWFGDDKCSWWENIYIYMRILVPWLDHLFEAKGFPTPSKVRVLSREEPKFKKKPLQKFLATMTGGTLFRFRICFIVFLLQWFRNTSWLHQNFLHLLLQTWFLLFIMQPEFISQSIIRLPFSFVDLSPIYSLPRRHPSRRRSP